MLAHAQKLMRKKQSEKETIGLRYLDRLKTSSKNKSNKAVSDSSFAKMTQTCPSQGCQSILH